MTSDWRRLSEAHFGSVWFPNRPLAAMTLALVASPLSRARMTHTLEPAPGLIPKHQRES